MKKFKKVARDIFKLGDFEKVLVFISACIVLAFYISKKIEKSPIDAETAKPILQKYSESSSKKLSKSKKKTEAGVSVEAESSVSEPAKNTEIIEEDEKEILKASDTLAISECLGESYRPKKLMGLQESLVSQPHEEVLLASAHHLESENSRIWYKIEKILISQNTYRILIAEPDENDQVGFPESLSFESYDQARAYINEVNRDKEVYTEIDKELIFNNENLLRAEIKTINDKPHDIKVYTEGKQLSCSSQAVDNKCICLN